MRTAPGGIDRGAGLMCPSAQPTMEGAYAVAIVGGTAGEPRVRWIEQPLPVTGELLGLAEPVEPTEVFRFAAPCAEGGCRHHDNDRCTLGDKLATLPVAVDVALLPKCTIRPTCRWYAEQGRDICFRCVSVVTTDYRASPDLQRAAEPLN